ncbi:MAG: hypothetical protein QM296_00920 [Bacillota bacterium]|nr:hypothetical protein [Bacillota bacterium]
MRWCPEIRAGTQKLTTVGQKRPFVPQNRAQTPISGQGWTKIALVPRNPGRNEKTDHSLAANWRCSTAAFSFLFFQSGGKRINKNLLCGRHMLWLL